MGSENTIRVVITDLDNTLFDWFHVWHCSFSALVEEVVKISGIERTQILAEIKSVNQKHKTSEYSFLLEELPSLTSKYGTEDILKIFDPAIHAFNSARKRNLALYSGVLETLIELRSKGVLIVGYTESLAFPTHYRIKTLELDGILDILYSSPDHDFPENISLANQRYYESDHYVLNHTLHRYTPRGTKKPNSQVLLSIVRDIGAIPSECIYVGDDISRDIAMAQEAKIEDIHAKYGQAHNRPEYGLLKAVTHWTDAEVAIQAKTARKDVKPSKVLVRSFNELLNMYSYGKFPGKADIKDIIEIWKSAINVQMHFTDISLKIRNMAILTVGAFAGAAGFILKEKEASILAHIDIISLAGLAAWLGFFMMDKFWYHKLLKGAVNHTTEIEERHKSFIPELTITKTISRHSPIKFWRWKIHSDMKLILFYFIGAIIVGFPYIKMDFYPLASEWVSAFSSLHCPFNLR